MTRKLNLIAVQVVTSVLSWAAVFVASVVIVGYLVVGLFQRESVACVNTEKSVNRRDA